MNRQSILASLRDRWNSRAAEHGLKRGTITYQKRLLEFMVGAETALQAAGQASIGGCCLLIAVGRDINELVKDE